MCQKVVINSESIKTHDYNRACADHDRGNWNHMIILNPEDKDVDVCTIHGNGTPISVWDGRAFVLFRVGDKTADVSNLLSCLESDDVQESLQAIVAGYSEEFDGSNYKGQLTDDAEAHLDGLIDHLTAQCEDLPMFWNPSDWYDPLGTSEVAELAWDEDRESVLESEIDIALGEGAFLDKSELNSYLDSVKEETDKCKECGNFFSTEDSWNNAEEHLCEQCND